MRRLLALADRLGGALLAPRHALAEADAGRGGLHDALLMLALKVICGDAPGLVSSAWTALVLGPGEGASLLVERVAAAITVDLVLMVGASLLITLLAGRRRSIGRDLDLAAVAWLPALTVELIGGLVAYACRGLPPLATRVVTGAGVAWMAALVLLAVAVARRRPDVVPA